MKHIKLISDRSPDSAAAWQDAVCAMADVLNAVIQAFGGSSPFVSFVDQKCAFPTPDDPGDDTQTEA